MQEFTTLFFGTLSPLTFLFTFLCFAAGFALFHFITVQKGIKNSPSSPEKFDFWYWLSDNFKDMTLFIIIAYLTIRFTPQILSLASIGNVLEDYTGSPFAFVVLGFAYQRINNALRKAANKTQTT
jgi:hypothetical protein